MKRLFLKWNNQLYFVVPVFITGSLLLVCTIFFLWNADHLLSIGRASLWVLTLIFLFFVSAWLSFGEWKDEGNSI
ncbi:hypothetical protein P6709_12500 [Jeotgalibacillus sp. ET6]|uniref:hypothetical protein n=1 Tax=Jeotgalibacillus sp. ET6 TaxID=3037260 RepID=UPI0024182F59|nr:hypothetical protein [Jeotgalibacillus sp. ET6]MDG5472568.1 hypothetical protein [Jeotgalibacillus sp. ET6]